MITAIENGVDEIQRLRRIERQRRDLTTAEVTSARK